MIKMLQNWKGTVEIDGQEYSSITNYHRANTAVMEPIHIVLHPAVKEAVKEPKKAPVQEVPDAEVVVTVKKYMTQKATPQFDFMAKLIGRSCICVVRLVSFCPAVRHNAVRW